MKSKRVRISFESVIEGKYTVIPPELIHSASASIRKGMKEFHKKNKSRKA
jgi:hypothetical protein